MTKFSKTEIECNRMLDGMIAEKKRLNETIAQLESMIEEDTRAMAKATSDADLKAYKEAAARKSDHEILREMNKQKLKKISNNPKPTADDIRRLIREMDSEYERQNAALEKETCEIGEHLFSTAYESRATANRIAAIKNLAKQEFNIDSSNSEDAGILWSWAESLVSCNRYQVVTGKNRFSLTDELNKEGK